MVPDVRFHRLRLSNGIRRMHCTPPPGPEKFIWPTFMIPVENKQEPIKSISAQAQHSIDQLLKD